MSKTNGDFEEVSVSRRAGRDLADEEALKLDDSHDLHPDKKDREKGKSSRDDRRKNPKKKKSGSGKIVLLLLLAIIAVVALMVGGMMLLKNGGLGKIEASTEAQTEAVTTEAVVEEKHVELAQDSNADILNLVKGYYDARVAQNTEAMAEVLAEGVEINTQELTNEAEFLEAYQNISTYVAEGMQEGENVVYITYDMKFKNIETAAPGMVPAYVKADSTGAPRLMFKSDFDTDVNAFVNEVSSSAEVKALTDKIAEAYQMAQDADPDLKAFIDALTGVTEETSEAASEEGAAETDENGETIAATEAQESGEETAASTAAASDITFTETDDIQYATTQVRCRQQPSLDGDDYTLVEAGEWVHVIGTSDEWYKVITQEHITGYIKAEYLSVDKPETSVE